MITIWFEPHSTSIDNEAGLASGWNDIDLSELGMQQCLELVDRNAERGIDIICSSDMQRAIKTVTPFASQQQVPVYIDKRLRECNYGDLTQSPKKQVDEQKARRINEAFPHGESYTDCMNRMGDFLDYLKQNFDGRTVLIVGHRATQYGLEHHILGKSIEQCVTDKWSWQPGWQYTF